MGLYIEESKEMEMNEADNGAVEFSDVHHCVKSSDPLQNLAVAASIRLFEMAPDSKYPLGYIRVREKRIPRKKRWLGFKKRSIQEIKKMQSRLPFLATVDGDDESETQTLGTQEDEAPAADFTPISTITAQSKMVIRLRTKRSHPKKEEAEKERKRKKRRTRQPKETLPAPPPELPDELSARIRDMGGSEIKFLLQKELLRCDVIDNNNRLSMPASRIRDMSFIREAEMKALNERTLDGNTGKLKGIKVIVLDPSMRENSLSFKRWEMKSCVTYNLTGRWYQLVTMNNLKKGQELKVWSFRNMESALCFAVAYA